MQTENGDRVEMERGICDGMGPLERTFGTAIAKIMDFLIIQKGLDYSEAEVAEMTGLSTKTVARSMPQLVDDGIAKVNRTVGGRIRMYWLHPKSTVAAYLETLALELASKRADEKQEVSLPAESKQSRLDDEKIRT